MKASNSGLRAKLLLWRVYLTTSRCRLVLNNISHSTLTMTLKANPTSSIWMM